MIKTIAVAGAGTMGSGIAFTAARSGFQVVLFDKSETVLEKAQKFFSENLDFLFQKQKITLQEKEKFPSTIKFTTDIQDCICDLAIEAIIESIPAKQELFAKLAALNGSGTILASNTSSLSITEIQSGLTAPGRVAGMHFFNPAHVMKLVEVVEGRDTDAGVAQILMETCIHMGKVPVLCKDSPGFIVNRVARHYYLEAMRIAESGIATIEEIDAAMENAGFKMGPFRLMDLIGMDINLSVSESLYDAFEKEPRFEPNRLQREKVAAGYLGRKTGKGFYDYPTKTGS